MSNVIKHKGQILVAILLLFDVFLVGKAFYLGDFKEAIGLVGACILMVWLLVNPDLYGKPILESIREVEKSEYLLIVVFSTILFFVGIVWPRIIS